MDPSPPNSKPQVWAEVAISKAVDVVEVARRRFFEGKLAVKEISIGTEVLGPENERRNVSTMEIKLEKKD